MPTTLDYSVSTLAGTEHVIPQSQGLHYPVGHHATTREHCRCVDNSLHVIESIEGITRQITPLIPDQVLVLQRKAIERCVNMMQCSFCSSSPTKIMLALVVCEKLVILIQDNVFQCNWSKDSRSQAYDQYTTKSGLQDKMDQHITLGSYRTNDPIEWATVVTTLFTLQGHRLRKLIKDLKSLAVSNNWHVQVSTLEVIERKFTIPHSTKKK